MNKDLDNFLSKYLNITNKNNVIEITMLNYISKNISNYSFNIQDFIIHLKNTFNMDYEKKKYILYKYDNKYISIMNNKITYKTSETIDLLNTHYKNKQLNLCFKNIKTDENLVSVDKYMDIKSKDLIIFNTKFLEILIEYDENDKHYKIQFLIKKPFEKKDIINVINNILDF